MREKRGARPKIATVERREASVSERRMAPHKRLACRKARPAGAPSTGALSRRSATPHPGARSKKAKPGRKKRAAGTKKRVLFDK